MKQACCFFLIKRLPGCSLAAGAERSLEKSTKSGASHVSSILAHSQRGLFPPLRRLSKVKRDKDRTAVINIWSTFTRFGGFNNRRSSSLNVCMSCELMMLKLLHGSYLLVSYRLSVDVSYRK